MYTELVTIELGKAGVLVKLHMSMVMLRAGCCAYCQVWIGGGRHKGPLNNMHLAGWGSFLKLLSAITRVFYKSASHHHWLRTVDTRAVNEHSRSFTVPAEEDYNWRACIAFKQEGGPNTVKLHEGSLTALLWTDTLRALPHLTIMSTAQLKKYYF